MNGVPVAPFDSMAFFGWIETLEERSIVGSHSESRFAKTRNGGRKDGRNKQPIKSSGCVGVFLLILAVGSVASYGVWEVL